MFGWIKLIIEPIRLELFKQQWRRKNRCNRTKAGNRFDIQKVVVGKETYGKLNVFSYNDQNSGRLYIGRYCSIASSVVFLLSGNHKYDCLSSFPFSKIWLNSSIEESKGDIIIDDDVWIAEHCLVLSGVHVGKGAVIAAGAIVNTDVPPYAVVGGYQQD